MSTKRIEYMKDESGKEYWLEPDTFKQHPLPASNMFSISNGETLEVNYDLYYDDELNKIAMQCRLTVGDTKGPAYHISSKEFMQVLYDAYIKKETFSRRKEISDYKEQAESLFIHDQMLNQGHLFNTASISVHGNAVGFIKYDNDIVGVFDTFKIYRRGITGTKIETSTMFTNINLSAEKSPTVEIIFSNGRKYTFTNIEAIAFKDGGILKEYELHPGGLTTSTGHEDEYIQLIVPIIENEPIWQDQRKNLMSSESIDSGIDERFGDIFDF